MNVKIIGVNPLNMAESKLIREGSITTEKGMLMKFGNPLRELKIRLIVQDGGDPELVLYIGKPVEKDRYVKRVEELKNRLGQKKLERK
jgi:hypothetical protein